MLRSTARRTLGLARFLYAQRIAGFGVPDEPHLDAASTAALNKYLHAATLYLEYGTGGSTVLMSRIGRRTIAIDSDRFYLRAVRRKLAPGHRVTLLHADIGTTIEWGMPIRRRPTPARLRRWRRYVEAPFEAVDAAGAFPDFVLVDGRFRVACVLETARRAALAGAATTIMLDDYEDRDHYRPVERWLGAPRRIGRAAIFEIDPARPAAVSEAAVADALRDVR